MLPNYRGGWVIRFSLTDGGAIGNHITDVPSLALQVRDQLALLTWGEAVEILNALVLLLDRVLGTSKDRPQDSEGKGGVFARDDTPVSELASFCLGDPAWWPRGRIGKDTFSLDGDREDFRVVLDASAAPDATPCSAYAHVLTLWVNGARVDMCLGEVVELAYAQARIIATAMFG